MRKFKRVVRFTLVAATTVTMMFNFGGCSKDFSPVSPDNGKEHFKTEYSSKTSKVKFLRFTHSENALQKNITVSKYITVQNGGQLLIQHGTPDGSAANYMYASNINPPYNIYQIDPNDVSNVTLIGQLQFPAAAIAMHPFNGLLYYIGYKPVNGVYPVATWDPATNTNSVLRDGSTFRPAGKLTFGLDGTLYGASYYNSYQLYTINTVTGAWTYYNSYNYYMGAGGDFAVNPDGFIYNILDGYLDKVNLSSNSLTNLGYVNLSYISGLCFGNDGKLYLSQQFGQLYHVNPANGITTYIGNTGLAQIADLAPVIAQTELSYAYVSLDIPSGSLHDDCELSLSMETTELMGGVAVTFQPHGTTFLSPAILNIEALGVDLTGVNPRTVNIYYDNQETGIWEPMEKDEIIVDVNSGHIKVVNARLPHFSRYAIGGE